jgi:soluble lytic murein transglycosylase-like protein
MRRSRRKSAERRHGVRRRVAVLLLSGLLVLAPSPAVHAQDAPVAEPAAEQCFSAHSAEASRRFRIPGDWIRAVLAAESAHDVGAVSDAGALGLMQVMPDTWDELRAKYRLGDDPFDPRDNILAGTAYLRELLDRYGDVTGMLAAYNAGPGRYDDYLTAGRPLPVETVDFVAKLAPALGGKPLPGRVPATPRPTDWREAPLFIVPAGGASPAGSLHPGGQPDAEATTDSAQDAGSTPAPSEGIFVARSGGESSP